MKTLNLVFLFVFLGSLAYAKDYPMARKVSSLSEYTSILSLTNEEDAMAIHKDDAQVIVYAQFEGADPVETKAYRVYDLLYVDVPPLYTNGVEKMAKGYEELKKGDSAKAKNYFYTAIKLFNQSKSEKTPSGKLFSSTITYKNYLDDKYLQCYLGLNKKESIIKYFEKIRNNPAAHSWVRNMYAYVEYLVENTTEGSKALTLIEKLLKINLHQKKIMELNLNKGLAMSLTKKYKEAARHIKDTVINFENEFPEVVERADILQSTIVIYHKKDYRAGIKYFSKILEKEREKATSDTFLKLGDCYYNLQKWEESRWNYVQAYLLENGSKDKILAIVEKVKDVNKNIPSKEGNKAIDQFLEKVISHESTAQ